MNQIKHIVCSCAGHSESETENVFRSSEQTYQNVWEFYRTKEFGKVLVVVGLCALGLILPKTLQNPADAIAEYVVFISAYLLSGWPVITTAGKNILKGRVFDENFLMTIATLGAIAIGELPEAVGVMLFFQIGELFQEQAVGRSRSSIKALLEVRPDYANLKVNDTLETVAPETVQVGQIILVKPGEKIPLDGEILEGKSQIDTAALTGESVPRSVKVGETVLAGMVNLEGLLTIKVTKRFGESSIAQILELVENAKAQKAETEKFITTFARYYTPIIVFISLGIAIGPPLLIPGATLEQWIYRALVVLVISCPCALVISIPLAYFGGVGGAAKRGILIKGSKFLDTLHSVTRVVFDKTGTLTQGVFQVTDVVTHNGLSQPELLQITAHAEIHSNHPVAQSIREAAQDGVSNNLDINLDMKTVSEYEEIAGYGIRATVCDRQVLAGNHRLLHRENIPHECQTIEGTVVHVAVDRCYAGYVLIADRLKEDAVNAITALKKLGVDQVVMLTGDDRTVAKQVSEELGLDAYHAQLLPEQKVAELEKLLKQTNQGTNHGTKLAFVGDGINDAPAIALADVGIAMGGLGSDAAIATADVVIMSDAPSKVAEAIQIARKTREIVWQNIGFASGIKLLMILLGIFGVASMWSAVFADVGVALLAILNAMRILNYRSIETVTL
jgi:Cd2+/Zn2+-exporting ATPase